MSASPVHRPSPNEVANESESSFSGSPSATSAIEHHKYSETKTQPHQQIRQELIQALLADLVGPFDPDCSTEILQLKPSQWYLTGFLVPGDHQQTLGQQDPNQADDVGSGNDDHENPPEETVQKQPRCFPSSMGLSVFVPASATIEVELTWAEYSQEDSETSDSSPQRPPNYLGSTSRSQSSPTWRRAVRGPYRFSIDLDNDALTKGIAVPNSPGVLVQGRTVEVDTLNRTDTVGLEAGTRALSLFVINRRSVPDPSRLDEQILFQVEMKLFCQEGFCPRPNMVGMSSNSDFDDRVADLQYRHEVEYAVGHGVAWTYPTPIANAPMTCIGTSWIPTSEVKKVTTHEIHEVETNMEKLAALTSAEDVRRKLGALPQAYAQWIEKQCQQDVGHDQRIEVRSALMNRAREAKSRIEQGIELLATSPDLLSAFCWANQAMARASRQQRSHEPKWRLFQLAFVLLNLSGIENPRHPDRETVELIFFPTGGGKTEAYLGVIAVTLLLRRIKAKAQLRPDAGLGVAVILRYTLRLLTLDQLERAAALVCSLELLRQVHVEVLGEARFSIGLWVGKSTTANRLAEAQTKIGDYKNGRGSNPFPLPHCPWCKTTIETDSVTLAPTKKPTEVRVSCMNPSCAFSGHATDGLGLPVLFVDEQIYQELPAFVIATVDKFAMLPWRGDTGKLFGRILGHDGPQSRRFYGPSDDKKGSTPLPHGLFPPELIVQDELHLISGPLGTMVGLYETGIEILCSRTEDQAYIKPKIIASTATVRRAEEQVTALFGRTSMRLFPPAGIDAFETFFAKVDHETPGRLYAGVAANGRAMKAILLRTYATLLGAGEKAFRDQNQTQVRAKDEQDLQSEHENPADVFTTVAGYFNSLRELGGMRRLVEDDVRTRCRKAEQRKPSETLGPHRWVTKREVDRLVELTSRESTSNIVANKAKLEKSRSDSDHVDVLLASNMISVGVDIDRLGLMVVAGQPKTTAEYIQATSRVGRKHPGLVVTCFNVHKPRDRSHYERFSSYHSCFYRYVETTSLTPFSDRALDRGLAALLITIIRLSDVKMTPNKAAIRIQETRSATKKLTDRILDRFRIQSNREGEESSRAKAEVLRRRIDHLLDTWELLVRREGVEAIYSSFDQSSKKSSSKSLLQPVDPQGPGDHHGYQQHPGETLFCAPTSMRDVEGTVHLWLHRNRLGGSKS